MRFPIYVLTLAICISIATASTLAVEKKRNRFGFEFGSGPPPSFTICRLFPEKRDIRIPPEGTEIALIQNRGKDSARFEILVYGGNLAHLQTTLKERVDFTPTYVELGLMDMPYRLMYVGSKGKMESLTLSKANKLWGTPHIKKAERDQPLIRTYKLQSLDNHNVYELDMTFNNDETPSSYQVRGQNVHYPHWFKL